MSLTLTDRSTCIVGSADERAKLSTGWVIGYLVGGGVVLIVVVLLVVLIVSAKRIGTQAKEIEEALEVARQNTTALWQTHEIIVMVGSISRRLALARKQLGSSS